MPTYRVNLCLSVMHPDGTEVVLERGVQLPFLPAVGISIDGNDIRVVNWVLEQRLFTVFLKHTYLDGEEPELDLQEAYFDHGWKLVCRRPKEAGEPPGTDAGDFSKN